MSPLQGLMAFWHALAIIFAPLRGWIQMPAFRVESKCRIRQICNRFAIRNQWFKKNRNQEM